MLWLTWRQHRMQMLVTTALLAVLGVVLLVNGLGAAGFAAQNPPAAGCPSDTPACAAYTNGMMEWMWSVGELIGWLPLLAPAMIGAFWGAPLLAREFEHGTHRLAWTQSVSRRRWLVVKVGGLGAVVTLGGLALSGIVNAWLAVFDSPAYPVNFLGNANWFRLVGIVPAAWWLSAFMLGVATGALFRRTLPAMAVTLALCASVFFGLLSARPFYAAPERHEQTKVMDDSVPEDSLFVAGYWTDRSGARLTDTEKAIAVAGRCGTDETTTAYARCTFSHGYRRVEEFHHPSSFWRFQWTEAGILLVPALALGGVAARRTLRPRI
ncbi:ABC transporter permease [Streptosporangium roseum]|uniref:ABC transporter permease n=1 Tax=Streptosporangium roseum TaxID=2001 RepID=UPI0033215D64